MMIVSSAHSNASFRPLFYSFCFIRILETADWHAGFLVEFYAYYTWMKHFRNKWTFFVDVRFYSVGPSKKILSLSCIVNRIVCLKLILVLSPYSLYMCMYIHTYIIVSQLTSSMPDRTTLKQFAQDKIFYMYA